MDEWPLIVNAQYNHVWFLSSLPWLFKMGFALLPERLLLKLERGMSQTITSQLEGALVDYGSGTKEKVINTI